MMWTFPSTTISVYRMAPLVDRAAVMDKAVMDKAAMVDRPATCSWTTDEMAGLLEW